MVSDTLNGVAKLWEGSVSQQLVASLNGNDRQLASMCNVLSRVILGT
jgi:hypothetical protein